MTWMHNYSAAVWLQVEGSIQCTSGALDIVLSSAFHLRTDCSAAEKVEGREHGQ